MTIRTESATYAEEDVALATNQRFYTIKQTAKARPAFSPAALRDVRFKATDRKNSRGEVIRGNGAAKFGVFLQVGRKVLVDLDAFDRWVESHREAA